MDRKFSFILSSPKCVEMFSVVEYFNMLTSTYLCIYWYIDYIYTNFPCTHLGLVTENLEPKELGKENVWY